MVSTQETTQGSGRGSRRFQQQMATARIVERRDLSDDLWLIKLAPSIPFTFKPGQYCTIGAEDIERPYSIVSAPEEPLLELFVELVPPPDGRLTPALYNLDVGAELTLRPKPKGIFTLDSTAKTHVFVSTVTGVAPTVSILRHALMTGEHGEREFHVLDGGSYFDELAYLEELRELWPMMYEFHPRSRQRSAARTMSGTPAGRAPRAALTLWLRTTCATTTSTLRRPSCMPAATPA